MNSNMFSGNGSPGSAFSAPSQAYVSDQYQYSPQLNQNNFQMLPDSMIPQQPPMYQYDHQLTGYPTRQEEHPQYPMSLPVAPVNEPRPTPPRRVRTQYTSHQLITLENAFIKNRYLCRSYRIKLSEDLNLTEKQIKVWFQNRRMKFKKESKRIESNQRYRKSTTSQSSPVNSISPNRANSEPQADRPTQRVQTSTLFALNPNTFTPTSAFHPTISSHFNAAGYSVGNQGEFPSDPYLREPDFNPDRPVLSMEDIQNPPILLDESYSFARVSEIESPLFAGVTGNVPGYDSHPANGDSSPEENGLLQL